MTEKSKAQQWGLLLDSLNDCQEDAKTYQQMIIKAEQQLLLYQAYLVRKQMKVRQLKLQIQELEEWEDDEERIVRS